MFDADSGPSDPEGPSRSTDSDSTQELTRTIFSNGAKVSGRYLIQGLLGQGSYGEVYTAFDEMLGRQVALKAMAFTCGVERGSLGGVMEEARTIAQLDHPNIIPVYDVGLEGRTPWMAMKIVQHESLAALAGREGSLETQRVVGLLKQAVAGLNHAHRRGIIHRDVKPSNILIERREDGQEHAWLADFGIAKLLVGETATTTSSVVGTPSYMAPEVVAGKKVDARADLFAVGCLAYEMILGQRAFSGDTNSEVLYSIVHRQPERLSELSQVAGKRFEAMVRRALAKSPEDRFQTAEELLRELQALEIGEEVTKKERLRRGWRRLRRRAEPVRWDGRQVLVVQDLYKGYTFRTAVLRGLNLTVETGSVYALLGRNGSGKSTLLRTILGIYHADNGSVAVFGRDPRRDGPAILARLGYVPELFTGYEALTVAQVIGLLAKFYPRWDHALCYELLRLFGLPLNVKIRDLSKGMKTKVSLLGALSHRPEFLVLDDPTIGLDAVSLQEVFDTLQEVSRREGATVLLASHNLEEVEKICTHVGFLRDGGILVSDTVASLRARTREVRLTFRDDAPDLSHVEQFKPVKSSGRRVTGIVFDTSSGAIEQLRAFQPEELQIRELSLKEIFVNFLR